jgi:hypothetical protein
MFEFLIPKLMGLLPDVIRRVLPAEKISEAEQAQLAQALQLEIMAMDWKGIEAEFKDRDSARNLAAQEIAKGNAWTSAAAAMVRPLWGIGCFLLVAYSVLASYEITPVLRSIIETVLMFYFGGRVIEKVLPTIMAGVNKK